MTEIAELHVPMDIDKRFCDGCHDKYPCGTRASFGPVVSLVLGAVPEEPA